MYSSITVALFASRTRPENQGQDTVGLNGGQASLRLRVDDNAEPARPDTFRTWIGGYDSGTTTVTSGNLQSHPP